MAPPPPMPQPALPPMREVTEDTPPDMLAGAMDLRVLLPDGHAVKMNVDRSTPMMDLLVHVTTANKMSPGSHVIQAVGEKGNILPYKPSTPIGALDTWTIQIVSKSKASGVSHKKAPLKASNQPFEQTFRLQVNLPRNQLFVTRVSPRTPLLEVLRHVCTEKGLDPDKYDLRNPMNPDEVLRLTCNLLDYKLQEVTVALRGTTVPHNHQSRHRIHATSAADIIALQHQQDISDKRRKSSGSTSTTNNSGGVFGFIFKRGSRSSVCEGSISSDSLGGQSISPARSDESLGPARSASPPLSSQQTLQRGGLQDQLRNQINSQMSRQQENPSHPVSLVSDKNLKQQMEGGQPPPPPLRHRKRRAPKPPVQNAENKKSSEFITPAPPSIPAPIPISCRKSRSLDNDEDEYGEEDIMVGGGRERTTLGKVKSTGQSGGASTGGTLISHSRNSSDSSGYHEASVLSESPESGVGGSGAPDTLPRRKQQQSQKSGVNVSSQVSSLSHSMGNLASNGPPSTVSSKTMTSSSSYSSLSASTSSLPGQKKKKAPAPPAPVPPAPAPQKQHVEAEVNSERVDAISNSALTKADEGKVPKVRKGTSLELDNAACIVKTTLEKSKSQPEKLTEHPKLVTLPTPTPNQSNGVNQPTTNPAPSAVGSDINPAASVNKLCPIVAPKPHPKVNPAVDAPRPWSGSGPDSEDIIPTPKPRSKAPMPKKRTAPRPAPRSTPATEGGGEQERKPSDVQTRIPKKPIAQSVNMSALSLVPAMEISGDTAPHTNSDGDNPNDDDDLIADNINLELFSGGTSEQTENVGQSNDALSSGEDFDESVIKKVLERNGMRTVCSALSNGVDDINSGNEIEETYNEGDDAVEAFSLKTCEGAQSESDSHKTPIHPLPTLMSASQARADEPMLSDSIEKRAIHSMRQVESAVNFSNIHGDFPSQEIDLNRFSSNSLCSEVDMPFVDGGGLAKMNRWKNMELFDQSSTSLEKCPREASDGDNTLEEGDPIANDWVVGYESDVELNRGTGDGSEVGSSAGSMTADSIDEVDYVRQDNAKAELIYSDKSVKPLLIDEPDKDTLYSHTAKINGIPPTLLPSPPPSLEFMGVEGEKPMDADGQVVGAVESEDLDWEYKLPAPPTGFEDDEVERGDGVVEGFITKKAEDERETWVAESEAASIPSTLSSAPSHRKIQVDSQRAQHLPNFRMSTYKASSDDGWEDPREDLGRINVRREDGFTKSNGRTFVLLNSDNEVKSEKSYIEVGKHLFETWASVSSKSSLSKGHYSNLDLSNSVSYTNPGLVMTSFKDTAENGVNPSRAGLKNEACVVRVSSFGGKSTKALKRSLSSTSSLISRHSSNDGKDNTLEKFDGGVDGPLKNNHLPLKNGIRSNSLSHSSRTVSLHDLARNSIQEECRLRESLDNGYHEENTTPKIVSSKWKKPQGVIGAKYGAQRMNSLQNLRKTSSELSINQTGFTNGWKDGKCDLEESSAPPKAYQWQEHHMMDNGMQEPLKSLQVLKGVLPQLKKSLSIDLKDNDPDESCLDRDEKIEDVNETEKSKDMESDVDVQNINAKANSLPRPNHHQSNFELAQQDEVADLTPKRYSYAGPPAINFGTWSERPKSEVSLKRDSDYRIGVGQAPRIRETQSMLNSPMRQPKSVASCNPSLNSHVDPPCPPPKPVGSNRVSVNIVSATKPEAVSRLPIVRSVELKKTAAATLASKPGTVGSRPLSCKFPSDLCEELTGALASLVDANRNGENRQLEEVNERRRRQQIPSVSAAPPPPPDVIASTQQTANPVTNLRRVGSAVGHDSGAIRVNGFMSQEKRQGVVPFAPVVKGFRLNSIPSSTPVQLANHGQAVQHTAPVPPPPPAVVCGVALKKRVEPASGPKFSENPRDNLLSAIREFGGRENLKKTAVRYK